MFVIAVTLPDSSVDIYKIKNSNDNNDIYSLEAQLWRNITGAFATLSGDFLNKGRDQLLVLTEELRGGCGYYMS